MREEVKSSALGGIFSFISSLTWLGLAKDLMLAFFLGLAGAFGGYVFHLLKNYIKRKYNEKRKN